MELEQYAQFSGTTKVYWNMNIWKSAEYRDINHKLNEKYLNGAMM